MPSSPYDAKGLLKSAIRDDSPVIFFEDKMMYRESGPVPTGDYSIPLGVAAVRREGEDITLIATSSMVNVALTAAEELAAQGISAEVIDPRTLAPLDEATLVESVRKTSRCIVIDEATGATAPRRSWPRWWPSRPSTGWTRRCSASARWTCRCPSAPRSRI